MRYSWIIVLSLLTGCALTPATPHATATSDEFTKDVTVVGWGRYENPFGGTFRQWRIRSWVDKATGAARHQLYVETGYTGARRFYDSAADENAKSLQVVMINHSVADCGDLLGCSRSETVGIALAETDLRSHASSGYRIKLSARSGDALILPITPEMIGLQFAEVDKYAQRPATAGSQAVPAKSNADNTKH
jgi:hypothetical protein